MDAADKTCATIPVLKVMAPIVFVVVDVTVIFVGPSILVIVVMPPKTPVPAVFVTLIPTTNPTVDERPVTCVAKVVDKISPDNVAVDTPDFVVMFGLGAGPHPTATYEAYAGVSPMRYFAIMPFPILVIIFKFLSLLLYQHWQFEFLLVRQTLY